ncbi:ribosomal protein S18 [Pseudoscourfieldia marina]
MANPTSVLLPSWRRLTLLCSQRTSQVPFTFAFASPFSSSTSESSPPPSEPTSEKPTVNEEWGLPTTNKQRARRPPPTRNLGPANEVARLLSGGAGGKGLSDEDRKLIAEGAPTSETGYSLLGHASKFGLIPPNPFDQSTDPDAPVYQLQPRQRWIPGMVYEPDQLNPLEMPGEAVHLERQAFNRRKTKANKQLTGADLHFMQARLANMLDDNGRIMPRRRTGLSYAQQRRASRAVKAARDMALLPHDESAQKIRRFESTRQRSSGDSSSS